MQQAHLDHWPAGVPQEIPQVSQTLDEKLRATAAAKPDSTALFFYGGAKNYAQLDAEVTAVAAYLQSVCGIAKGDRVGLYMQNAPQFVAAFYGAIRAGAIVVPINAMHLEGELRYICEDAHIATLITGQDLLENALPLYESGLLASLIVAHYGAEATSSYAADLPPTVAAPFHAPPAGVVTWASVLAAGLAFNPVALSPSDPCCLPYTSGSTGRGKGCVHTHQSVLHTVGAVAMWFGHTGDEVHLGAAPLCHVIGMQAVMNMTVVTGACAVLMTRWNAATATRLIADQGVTNWGTVPTAVIDLLNTPGLKATDLRSLRHVFGGGSAMPVAVAERLAALTGLAFVEGFGMTETMGPIIHDLIKTPKAGSVGIPIQNAQAILLDPETLTPSHPGEVGEIALCSPQIMTRYWNNKAADAETFLEVEGRTFLRTGDLAEVDAQGRFYIVDRLKRMINASGFKVWPAEVENTLYKHEAIAEVCVISAKDAYRGENVKAVAVLKPGASLDAAELAAWAKEHMAAYKVPRLLEVVDSLPKSAAGKVLWRQLQDAQDAQQDGAA